MRRSKSKTSNLPPQRLFQSLPAGRNDSIGLDELVALLSLDESDRAQLDDYLTEFVRAGLASAKGGRYWRKPSGALIGTLRGTRSGHAFVVPDDERERKRGDLFINRRWMGSALNGDTVIARIAGSDERGRIGRIQAVLTRANPTVVGKLVRTARECFISPVEQRFLYEIVVAPASLAGAKNDDIVVVEITRPPAAGQPPAGRVVEILGREDDPGIDLKIVIRKHRLPDEFPDAALEEAEAISETIDDLELNRRVDFRGQPVITIDGENARDFDDAVSLKTLPNGRLQLGVHIADVSFYVRDGSALDEEAYVRGTSVYFPERAIPMLPERLSNGICSLNPNVDRLTMSAVLEMDSTARLIDYQLVPTVIRSCERMTYTAVNDILSAPEGEAANRYAHVREMLLAMHRLALASIKRREQRGAIDFDLPEAELLFNDEGQIGGIVRAERNIAHRLIEEFMLLANETVATHLDALGVPLLYRIHEEPNPTKVAEFAEIAASFGHRFSTHGPVPQRGFQHLAREIRGKLEERLLSYLMLRSMQRARYAAKNEGHFGLAMKTYTHFTSPIRRYPDLVVHRVLREVLELKTDEGNGDVDLGLKRAVRRSLPPILTEQRETELRSELENTGEHSSARERAADDAERELMDWRKAEFMADRVGDDFEGVITSVKDYGFYVELNEVFVEGLVHVSTLTDDRYRYEERRHQLVGVWSGRRYRLGDALRVQVVRVDRGRHLIDFAVV